MSNATYLRQRGMQLKHALRLHFPRVAAGLRHVRLRKARRALHGASAEGVFTGIFRAGGWRSESASGEGSTAAGALAIRERLPEILQKYGVRTLLDVPCGDFYWMRQTSLDLDRYVGGDIVRELIDNNRREHGDTGGHPRTFVHLDLSRDPLPKADMILCRDCLIHLSREDAFRALANIRRSGAKYLLTTTFTRRRFNDSIPTGHFYPINLQAPPFSLPSPMELLDEQCDVQCGGYRDKHMGLWRVADIPRRWDWYLQGDERHTADMPSPQEITQENRAA